MPKFNDFDTCNHKWNFHIDSASSGYLGSKPRQSFFICENCQNVINLQEKCALEQTNAQKMALKLQGQQSNISMRANIISALVLIVAFLSFLYGNKL